MPNRTLTERDHARLQRMLAAFEAGKLKPISRPPLRRVLPRTGGGASNTRYRGQLVNQVSFASATAIVDNLTLICGNDAGEDELGVYNVFQLWGHAGSPCIIEWNVTEERWELERVYNTSRYIGSLMSALSSGDPTADMGNLSPLDGPGGLSSISPVNVHSWDGALGAACRAEWNQYLGRWELYQVSC